MRTATTDAEPGSSPLVSLHDTDYYLDRIRQECRSAKSAQIARVARVHLAFAAHYLRSISSAVEQRFLDSGGDG